MKKKTLQAILFVLLTAFCMSTLTACNVGANLSAGTGEKGIGILKTEIINGELIITYTNGDVINVGKVVQDEENPQGLDFYLLPDGTYGVKAGMALYLEEIVIPETYMCKAVTQILPYAFQGGTNLKSIAIPNTITSICSYAFSGCANIESIVIPNSVTNIGNSAFSSCRSLTSVTIPDSVVSIGGDAFVSCDKLENLTIGSGVTSIGRYAFDGCNLKSVIFQNPNGWSIGGETISSNILSNPSIAANYFDSTYYEDYYGGAWTRTN